MEIEFSIVFNQNSNSLSFHQCEIIWNSILVCMWMPLCLKQYPLRLHLFNLSNIVRH
ncbi:unnamed protein product [Moneuplotes crassus]|uniref:Uncharacterized protein n=1 Tax=Euplotes crassus TaxID=5936 RepID=A0AAD1YBL6_EUPCR|nr:unnamed protein product [Moneuplotes crassus]